ncbi:hypothetical protein V6N11_070899 [Hibiscus sabdariffa]|uniref:Uncharacterized protein n=1 Tax=Hibiscus sabdariffa TaxID=183260 RepID=A0ABR1ZP50_9ROSI
MGAWVMVGRFDDDGVRAGSSNGGEGGSFGSDGKLEMGKGDGSVMIMLGEDESKEQGCWEEPRVLAGSAGTKGGSSPGSRLGCEWGKWMGASLGVGLKCDGL